MAQESILGGGGTTTKTGFSPTLEKLFGAGEVLGGRGSTSDLRKEIGAILNPGLQPTPGRGQLGGVPTQTAEQRIQAFKQEEQSFLKNFGAPGQHSIWDTTYNLLGIGTDASTREKGRAIAGSIVQQAGRELGQQIQGVGRSIEKQKDQGVQDLTEQWGKKIQEIEQRTSEDFQRGLLNGQTVQEIAGAQRTRRLGFVNEAANQQRATLFRQNEFTQEQLQAQGRQSELAARQTTGARGIGGSSVENQIIAGQQADTASQEAQAQEQLGQGLFTVNEQTAKQSADIEADIKKTIQEQSSTMQAAFMSKQASDRTDIINQQQGKIQELQNAYVLKRTEIDELTRKVQSAINGLIA